MGASTISACFRIAILAVAAACATAARAAEFEVRSTADQERAAILLTGPIVKGDLERFQKSLRAARKARPTLPPLLALDSLGGHLDVGMAIARAAKREGVPTAVMPGAVCGSACAAIFFGGFDRTTGRPDRTAYGSARIGVHNWRNNLRIHGWDVTIPITPAKAEATRRQIEAFHDEMRISQDIRTRLEQTRATDIYVLTWRDLEGSEIARRSAHDDLALFAAPSRKWPCVLSCLLRTNVPAAGVTWPQSTLAAVGLDDGTRVMTGAIYLETWPTLSGRSVRTVCTIWYVVDEDFACATTRRDGSVGYVMIRRSLPERPVAASLRLLCATVQPLDACRMEITGIVRQTPAGPIIHSATSRHPPHARPAVASAATN